MSTCPQTVLFLCTGNYYRSRYAEMLFNFHADDMQISWQAESRGLALERGIHNVGPIATCVVDALIARGVYEPDPRFPLSVSDTDFRLANLIIALKEEEHRPLMLERFPHWQDHVEYWTIHDTDCATIPETLQAIEKQIEGLLHRLRQN